MSNPFLPSPTVLNDFATDLVLARPNPCKNCGPWPCYHICPNSPHYYSPEQERYDDANYDRSEYYREGGFDDPDFSLETEIPLDEIEYEDALYRHCDQPRVYPSPDTDDIPF